MCIYENVKRMGYKVMEKLRDFAGIYCCKHVNSKIGIA